MMDHIIRPDHCVICDKRSSYFFKFACGNGCWPHDLNEIVIDFKHVSGMSRDDIRSMMNGMTFNDVLMLMKLQATMK